MPEIVTTLRSGRRIAVRPIEPTDGDALVEAFGRLSDVSRYNRFLVPKPALTPRDVRYLTVLDGDDHVAVVATPPDDRHRILAVARYVRLADDPETAEFAITVGDAYQGEGLGSLLGETLTDIARAHGIQKFTATVLAENIAAHRLMRRLTGRLAGERHHGPVDELDVDLVAA